jgi:hypothetical protein
VIKAGTARGRGNNATRVALEYAFIGFDGNRNWSVVKSGFELISVLRGDIGIAIDFSYSLTAIVRTDTITGYIWIIFFSF